MAIFNPEIHHRRSIRLIGFDYSHHGYYFVTICLNDVRCMLATVHVGVRHVGVRHGEPLHGEPLPRNEYQHIIPQSLGMIVNHYKSAVTRWTRRNGFPGRVDWNV